jgi:hypothetical protein
VKNVQTVCTRQVPYTVRKPVHYTKTICVPRTVTKQVPYTVTRMVPHVTCVQVPVTVNPCCGGGLFGHRGGCCN